MQQCQRIKANGERCKAPASGANGLCYSHDPATENDRKKSARRAGKTGGRGRPSTELKRLRKMFEELAKRVDDGDVVRADAAVMGQLLNGARACIRDLIAARGQEELIGRMEEIEAELQAQKERRGNRVA
jgi:hypothetical protein